MKRIRSGDTCYLLATIDRLGRIVVPKPLRTHFGLNCGDRIIIGSDGDRIYLERYFATKDLEPHVRSLDAALEELTRCNNLPMEQIQALQDHTKSMHQILEQCKKHEAPTAP